MLSCKYLPDIVEFPNKSTTIAFNLRLHRKLYLFLKTYLYKDKKGTSLQPNFNSVKKLYFLSLITRSLKTRGQIRYSRITWMGERRVGAILNKKHTTTLLNGSTSFGEFTGIVTKQCSSVCAQVAIMHRSPMLPAMYGHNLKRAGTTMNDAYRYTSTIRTTTQSAFMSSLLYTRARRNQIYTWRFGTCVKRGFVHCGQWTEKQLVLLSSLRSKTVIIMERQCVIHFGHFKFK